MAARISLNTMLHVETTIGFRTIPVRSGELIKAMRQLSSHRHEHQSSITRLSQQNEQGTHSIAIFSEAVPYWLEEMYFARSQKAGVGIVVLGRA
jgi:hypothetical protein